MSSGEVNIATWEIVVGQIVRANEITDSFLLLILKLTFATKH